MIPKLVIFDVEGTLVTTISGKTFRQYPADWTLLPDRRLIAHQLRANDIKVALATNQGGAAFGFFQESDMMYELHELGWALDINYTGNWSFPNILACFTHPKGTKRRLCVEDDRRRKPNPGMLQEAMAWSDTLPNQTVMVGDRPEDMEAAATAGIQFWFADVFFSKPLSGILLSMETTHPPLSFPTVYTR